MKLDQIIYEKFKAFDSEVTKGLRSSHLEFIAHLVKTEMGFKNYSIIVDMQQYKIIIHPHTENWMPVFVKNNEDITNKLQRLQTFLGLPMWSIEFAQKS